MAALSSACYVRQQPGQPLKTLNVTNAILRTDKAPSSYRPQCTAKRKSAVELLQETKSLYVKSETVLDRKQELRRSLRSSGSSDKGSSSHDNVSGCYHYKGNCCNWSSGSYTCLPPPKSPRLVAGCQRKSTADSQQLQNDLRRLLNADSKENLFEATSVFLDDVIVPPPVQYRRSVSRDQQQHNHHESEQEPRGNDDSYLQQQQQEQQHQPCTCAPSAVCHKSLPDLTDVAAAAVASTTAAVMAAANLRRCRRSVSSGSVAAGDCADYNNSGGGDDNDQDDDDDDDIFEMYRGVPSPHGFGNKSSRPDETDGVATNNVTCSFPDSLSLTSYKTDARWQQSAHGETGSSVGEENGGSVSPVKSTVSHGRGRRRRPQSGPTVACVGQQLPPPPPPPVAMRRNHRNNNNTPTATGGDEFRGRPILRSKSDVGHGAPNRPLSLLSAGPLTTAAAAADACRDVYYDPEQLEKFFGHLGLDPDEYKSIVKNDSDEGSQVCFGDSNSSVGSVSGGSNSGYGNGYNNNSSEVDPCTGGRGVCGVSATCGPAKSGGNSASSSSEQQLPSIVERNARIIKWLWNCRKANLQQQQTPPTPWST